MKNATRVIGVAFALQAGIVVFASQSGIAAAGESDGVQAGTPAILAVGTEINATLNRSVGAGSVKVGDQVTAKVIQDVEVDDKVVVPKGATLVGRVTRSEPRKSRPDGISASELGVVFDRVTLKNGGKVALKGFVGAVARSATEDRQRSMLGTIAGTRGADVQGSPTNSSVDDGMNRQKRSREARGGTDWRGTLAPGARGVFGLDDLELEPSADSGVVLVSKQSNAKLDTGTQLLVVCAGSPEDAS